MKKLKLKLSNFAGAQDEILTRSQLKAILGGSGSGDSPCCVELSECRCYNGDTEMCAVYVYDPSNPNCSGPTGSCCSSNGGIGGGCVGRGVISC